MSSLPIQVSGAIALTAIAFLLLAARDHHKGPAMNFHVIDDKLSTGGHFVGDGLARLADEGLEVVIDLRPADAGPRRGRVVERGVEYVHVPVSWEDPQRSDFDDFAKALAQHRDKRVLVQCAANYRASAMTYLYRTLLGDVPEADARRDLETVWEPNRRWRRYIEDVSASFDAR